MECQVLTRLWEKYLLLQQLQMLVAAGTIEAINQSSEVARQPKSEPECLPTASLKSRKLFISVSSSQSLAGSTLILKWSNLLSHHLRQKPTHRTAHGCDPRPHSLTIAGNLFYNPAPLFFFVWPSAQHAPSCWYYITNLFIYIFSHFSAEIKSQYQLKINMDMGYWLSLPRAWDQTKSASSRTTRSDHISRTCRHGNLFC